LLFRLTPKQGTTYLSLFPKKTLFVAYTVQLEAPPSGAFHELQQRRWRFGAPAPASALLGASAHNGIPNMRAKITFVDKYYKFKWFKYYKIIK
jgi:hypothetical protein